MKLTTELAEIIRKKYIDQIKLTEAEALKWNDYLTSTERAIKRQAYQDATPEQRIALRQLTNDAFNESCAQSIAETSRNRAFIQQIFQLLIQSAATALIAQVDKI